MSDWADVTLMGRTVRLPVRLIGLLYALPKEGEKWTRAERDAWMELFRACIDRYYPASPSPSSPQEEEETR